jgi:hypothetical protein
VLPLTKENFSKTLSSVATSTHFITVYSKKIWKKLFSHTTKSRLTTSLVRLTCRWTKCWWNYQKWFSMRRLEVHLTRVATVWYCLMSKSQLRFSTTVYKQLKTSILWWTLCMKRPTCTDKSILTDNILLII